MKTFRQLWKYVAESFLEWEIFQIKAVEEIKIHSLRFVTSFPRKSCRLWDDVRKYFGAREAADNTVYARWMVDK